MEFHILQSFPVTCLNRDDVGAPKTAVVGGTTRSRVSSQCWKRQVRLAMREFGANLGTRTKLIAEFIKKSCLANDATEDQANYLAELVSSELSGDVEGDESKGSTLLFITQTEADAFAKKMKDFQFSFEEFDAEIKTLSKEIKEQKNKKKKTENIDEVALAEKEVKLKS
ncbi:MAG: type I-E CRISPR-associated protein Cas7/Cse4/CasC, partial [bacterium]